MKVVFLDPGHGGHDPGAVGPSGLKESDMALDVCLRARDLLDPYVMVFLSRERDEFVSLSRRAEKANEVGADAFVSYHFNAANSAMTALSFEGFTTPGDNRSDDLATAILEHHGKLFPEQVLRPDLSDGDPDKEANFTVIKRTACPSMLMEGEFIHTKHGEKLIKNPDNRQKMAEAVKLGVLEFLGISSGGMTDAEVEETVNGSGPDSGKILAAVEAIELQCRKIREVVSSG